MVVIEDKEVVKGKDMAKEEEEDKEDKVEVHPVSVSVRIRTVIIQLNISPANRVPQ